MVNVERKLYQSNKLGFVLVLLYIALNVIYTIYVLNSMETTFEIGIFILLTIALLLLGFLTAVKVQNYSMLWAYVAIAIGLFQFIRITFTNYEVSQSLGIFLIVILILSGLLCIAGGIVSIMSTLTRQKCVKEYNRKNDYPIK